MRQFIRDHDLRAFLRRQRRYFHDHSGRIFFWVGVFVAAGFIIQVANTSVNTVTKNQDRNYEKTSAVLERVSGLQLQNNQLSQQLKVYAQCLADLQVRTSQGEVLTGADIDNCNAQASKAKASMAPGGSSFFRGGEGGDQNTDAPAKKSGGTNNGGGNGGENPERPGPIRRALDRAGDLLGEVL